MSAFCDFWSKRTEHVCYSAEANIIHRMWNSILEVSLESANHYIKFRISNLLQSDNIRA